MQSMIDYGQGIHALDAQYERPRCAAIHLVVEAGRCSLVDTANNAAVPRVLEALHSLGLTPAAVDYIVLTHIHLDHAGGASALMQCLPNARLVVHPRGVRHMCDPQALLAGVTGVYGADYVQRVYGAIAPIDPDRIITAVDGGSVTLGDATSSRTLSFLDTPGHARHHIAIRDSRTGHFFTGDTFGLSYRELDVAGRPSILPTTTPVQFDPPAAHRSVDAILAFRPEALYLTHFAQVRDVERLGADLHRLIDAHAAIAEAERGQPAGPERHARLKAGVTALVLAEQQRQGWTLDQTAVLNLLAMDIDLNAAGLGSWLDSAAPHGLPAQPA